MGLVIRCWKPGCRYPNGERSLIKARNGNRCLKCDEPLKHKTKGMYYGFNYRDDSGKLRWEFGPKGKIWDKKTAEYEYSKIVKAKVTGDRIPQKQDAKTTFQDLADWFRNLPKSKGKKDDDRKERSLKHLLPFFGDKLLRDITPSLIVEYIDLRSSELSYRKQPTKPATIERELACMKKIINWAIDNDKAERSPFRRGIMPEVNNARKRVLTIEEYPRLIAECPDYIKPVVKLAYYTGMRRGEILKLTWDMVDLKRMGLDLPPEICKTNRGRFIPLNPEMVEMFKAMPHGLPGVSVFTRRGKAITGSTIRVGWETACKRAGIPCGSEANGATFHDLRRTCKTNMEKAGIGKERRDVILGHSLTAMDVHYIVIFEDDLHKAVSQLTEWLSKAAAEAQAKPDVHQNVHQRRVEWRQ